jgi:RNA polymerase sigma-70 factor, ECF subfamily
MASASTSPSESFTSLLERFAAGDQDIRDQLVPLVHSELHRIAAAQMRRERPNHTLQPTALINEAFLRLTDQPLASCHSKAHFLALSAKLMRRILVDYARTRKAAKRGGMAHQVILADVIAGTETPIADILPVHELLEELRTLDPRQADVVEMHFFGGMTFDEIASVLTVTTRTVKRDWSMARAWLHSRLVEDQ